jgi:DNA-binding transcriptional ArsR family regulator
LIERIRRDMQQRLQQLLTEAEKLKGALAALGDHDASRTSPTPRPARPVRRAAPTSKNRSATPTNSRVRKSSGVTRTAVLEGLAKSGEAMTAGELATATGLGRGTISTTLSTLAGAGVVVKADRGYRLPAPSSGE